MSAVWRAARAAVRRRKLQTTVIGFVVFIAAATTVLALALLAAASAPFDHAFARQRGAHVVATFDPERVTNAQLAATAELPEVAAAAGPFSMAVVEVSDTDDVPGLIATRRLTVVGRADPAGDPVGRVDLWQGRWATAPGEIVLNLSPPPPGHTLHLPETKITLGDGHTFTVVGFAHSLSRTAGAWVSPEQVASLQPTSTQMLYRFTDSDTSAEIETGLRAITDALPASALQGSQSYLVLKQQFTGEAGAYVSFLLVFGALGLGVSILIVANVVSGAVVSGFRHIGILKALGFTPRQVVAVYLIMVSVPALAGSAAGTVVGHTGASLLLADMFRRLDLGDPGVSLWADLAGLLGLPGVVVLAALVPALRAHRLPAAMAISAGSAPRAGRGLRVQRWLSGVRLPRPVSLGLGLPFARPGRTALTLAAVLLGVVTVTFATGLASSVNKYAEVTDNNDTVGVRVHPPDVGQPQSPRSDEAVEALLRSLPGTVHVTVNLEVPLALLGDTREVNVSFLRGDWQALGYQDQVVEGRLWERAGEVVVPSQIMRERGLAVGDQLTLQLGRRQVPVTVVGETMAGGPGPGGFLTGWDTLGLLGPTYEPAPVEFLYQVELDPAADVHRYIETVHAADPGLAAWDNSGSDDFAATVVAFCLVLTVLLGTVAALGVFNTTLLNVRERRRDLGVLKSIGMTPRQVVMMVVTSMAALGMVGGLLALPLGILAHRLIVPIVADAVQVTIPASLLAVWQLPVLGLLTLAGVIIAVLGALIPARAGARLTIAEVLHNE